MDADPLAVDFVPTMSLVVLENATGNRSTPYHTIAISPAGEATYVIGGGGKTTGRSGRVVDKDWLHRSSNVMACRVFSARAGMNRMSPQCETFEVASAGGACAGRVEPQNSGPGGRDGRPGPRAVIITGRERFW